jgi:putative transposase
MDKSIYGINDQSLTYGRGYAYSLQYHIVWCTKYRKQILTSGIDEELKVMLEQIAAAYSFKIMAMEVMPDHVHLLLDCKPQCMISDMVKIMKGNTARWLFLKYPELKRSLWGGHLWNPSYCAVTVSDRSRAQVMQYIESQKDRS